VYCKDIALIVLYDLVVVYYCRTYYKAVRMGGGVVITMYSGGYVLGYDEPRLVLTSLTTTH
jgi:hypothetical protein